VKQDILTRLGWERECESVDYSLERRRSELDSLKKAFENEKAKEAPNPTTLDQLGADVAQTAAELAEIEKRRDELMKREPPPIRLPAEENSNG